MKGVLTLALVWIHFHELNALVSIDEQKMTFCWKVAMRMLCPRAWLISRTYLSHAWTYRGVGVLLLRDGGRTQRSNSQVSCAVWRVCMFQSPSPPAERGCWRSPLSCVSLSRINWTNRIERDNYTTLSQLNPQWNNLCWLWIRNINSLSSHTTLKWLVVFELWENVRTHSHSHTEYIHEHIRKCV
jgi:hypothetical protein